MLQLELPHGMEEDRLLSFGLAIRFDRVPNSDLFLPYDKDHALCDLGWGLGPEPGLALSS